MNLFCDEWTGSLDAAQQTEWSIQKNIVKMKRKKAIVGIVAITTLRSSVFCISCPPTKTPKMSVNQLC